MFKIQQVKITRGDFLVMHHFSQSDDHVNAKCNECMNACRMQKFSEILVPKYFPKGYHSLIQKLDYISNSIAFVRIKYLT